MIHLKDRENVRAGSLACILALSGCATLESKIDTSPKFDADRAGGLTYFLPQRFVTMEVSAEVVDLQKMKAALPKLEAAAKAATEAKKKLEKTVKTLRELASKLEAGSDARTRTERELTIEEAKLRIAKEKEAQALAAFALLNGQIARTAIHGVQCKFKISTRLSESFPDPTLRVVTSLKHNPLRDDTYEISISKTGLLSSADVEADDKLGVILTEIAGAAGGVTSNSVEAEFPIVIEDEGDDTPPCIEYKPVKFMFDPLRAEHQFQLEDYLRDYPIRVRFDHLGSTFTKQIKTDYSGADRLVVPDGIHSVSKPEVLRKASAIPPSPTPSNFLDPQNGTAVEGLYYRSSAPILMTVEQEHSKDNWMAADAAVLMLPQAGPVNFIPFRSSAFVKTVDDVKFASGELRSWSAERPSEVLEVVRLPVKILKALISVPAELISIKVDYSSSEQQLAQAQAAILQQEKVNDAYLNCLTAAGDDIEAVVDCSDALSPSDEE